jgi:hypothetical protein
MLLIEQNDGKYGHFTPEWCGRANPLRKSLAKQCISHTITPQAKQHRDALGAQVEAI